MLAADPSSANTTTQPAMWRAPQDALIADPDGVIEATPPRFTDQMPSFPVLEHWTARILRRADAKWDGMDPTRSTRRSRATECRARWPRCHGSNGWLPG